MPRERSLTDAPRDLAEVRQADFLVLDTLDEDPNGGRELEAGYFLGWWAAYRSLGAPGAAPFLLVGPVRNVFHELAEPRCPSWEEAFVYLAEFARKA